MAANNTVFNPADPSAITREYMDNIIFEGNVIDSVTPDISTEFLGHSFNSPVMSAALSHLKPMGEGRKPALLEYAEACRNKNLAAWLGMSENEGFGAFAAEGAKSIRIIKPYADREKMFNQIKFAEEHGAIAVGIDSLHIYNRKGYYDVVEGEQMAPLSRKDLEELVSSTKLPFIMKDILSVSDAVKSVEAGAKALLVSHHHGLVPYPIAPAMVLPEIRRAVGDDTEIFADCCVESGADVFRLLALGADGVSVGRALMGALRNGGTQGAEELFTKIEDELRCLMAYTGFRTVKEINPSVLWSRKTGAKLFN